MDISQTEPLTFRAGTTVQWQRQLDDYSVSDGWALNYSITGAGGNKAIVASGVGTLWTATLAASANNLPAGIYSLFGYVVNGSVTSEIFDMPITVLASLIPASSTDTRSYNQQIVDTLRTAILNYSVRPFVRLEIAGRLLIRPELNILREELGRFEYRLKMELRRAAQKSGKTPGGKHLAKFVRPQ